MPIEKTIKKKLFFALFIAVIILGLCYFGCLYLDKKNISTSQAKRADLNGNLIDESYTLIAGRLTIAESQKTIWQSPADWQIDSFVLADANNDGLLDLNLSLWKPGSFGTSKPFWLKENDPSVKNHFFIYNLSGDKLKMVWGSSNLGAPNCEFLIQDIDGDSQNELLVIEGEYRTATACQGRYVALWSWNGWGFSNDWRSGEGDYSNLRMSENDTGRFLSVDHGNEVLFFPDLSKK
ncbi:hypothetical protein GYA13_02760 [Candidatus Kuenenbacteria bacterium]|nr:hypothetical protein [Candidatus Kuenenbacteria bacterium]